jgi:uncharacterized membrane protein YdjX (TVP38/TMEM64 family)
VRAALFAAMLAGLITAVVLAGFPDAGRLEEEAADVGAPVFLLLYAGLCLLLVPRNVLSVAAGLLFGFGGGLVVALPGALLAAVAGFALGRLLGREAVERFTGARVARVDALLERRGVAAVVVCRLLPVVPFGGVNYAAGLTGVRFRDYVVGTAIGMVPGAVAYVAVGALGAAPASPPFVVGVSVLLGLSLLGSWIAGRRRRSGRPGSGLPARPGSATGNLAQHGP